MLLWMYADVGVPDLFSLSECQVCMVSSECCVLDATIVLTMVSLV